MKKAQTLAALATLVAKARKDTNRPFKPWNLNLYYGHLYMEYYYFCQQCKDYFKVAGLLSYKRVLFIASFLKDYILNQ